MKKYLLAILLLAFWSCEEEIAEDTTPPTVTITFPQDGSTIYEIANITCLSTDNDAVEKVELWVNGSPTTSIDNTEPYSLEWNTTTFDDGSYFITVRSYDVSGNTTDSAPIYLTVDNSQSNPLPVEIISLIFENGGYTITWNQSNDSDFSSYELKKSTDSQMNNYTVIFSTDSSEQTTYFDKNINPLIYYYYQITVKDIFQYETDGVIYSSSLDPVPNHVNVNSVTYNLDEMRIEWEESSDGDFKHYHLLHSLSVGGDKTSLTIITNKSTTSYTITEFNPSNENWYWVEVSDTLGQTSIGTGKTNEIDSPPAQVNVSSVTYDLIEMVISWSESIDNDFVSYDLLQSDTENGNYTSLVTITDQATTFHSLTDYDPAQENWFKVKVTDYWNLTSLSNGYMVLDNAPASSVLYPITYDDGFQISWSQNNDDDFVSYKLYESLSEDMVNQMLVYETNDRTETTFIKTIQNFRYYQILVEDTWGLHSTSNIEVGDYEVELWGEYYSVLNTTELSLNYNDLTGTIPPEIGNLINLTKLEFVNNQLTGEIPPEIGNLTNLTRLNLSENQLTGEIPPEVGNLTNLIWLYIQSNELTGSIPPEIGNLPNLIVLDLRYNQLTSSIPPEIGNLTNLTNLNLNENQLTGEIPPEIGNLTNLTNLLLRYNQLTGEIPESICNCGLNLSSSATFSIIYNQLCPPYPTCIEDYVGYQDTSNCD